MKRRKYKNVFVAVRKGEEEKFESRAATRPTWALPGTFEKLQVMHLRALRGEDLFHPDDVDFPLVLRS
jgi:hypothetical protein